MEKAELERKLASLDDAVAELEEEGKIRRWWCRLTDGVFSRLTVGHNKSSKLTLRLFQNSS